MNYQDALKRTESAYDWTSLSSSSIKSGSSSSSLPGNYVTCLLIERFNYFFCYQILGDCKRGYLGEEWTINLKMCFTLLAEVCVFRTCSTWSFTSKRVCSSDTEEASFQICDASIFMYLKKRKVQLYALMMQTAVVD